MGGYRDLYGGIEGSIGGTWVDIGAYGEDMDGYRGLWGRCRDL